MSRSDTKKTITTAVLTAPVASACKRSQRASEELAKQAERARAAHVSQRSGSGVRFGAAGRACGLLAEAFRTQKPTGFGSPEPLRPCSLDQVDWVVPGRSRPSTGGPQRGSSAGPRTAPRERFRP